MLVEIVADEWVWSHHSEGTGLFPYSPKVPKDAKNVTHPEARKKFLGWYVWHGGNKEQRDFCNEAAKEVLAAYGRHHDSSYGEPLDSRYIYLTDAQIYSIDKILTDKFGGSSLRWTHHRRWCTIQNLYSMITLFESED